MNYWIVVVDDNPLSLTHAKNILKEKDMRVSCLRSGRELLKFMAKNAPDLVPNSFCSCRNFRRKNSQMCCGES